MATTEELLAEAIRERDYYMMRFMQLMDKITHPPIVLSPFEQLPEEAKLAHMKMKRVFGNFYRRERG